MRYEALSRKYPAPQTADCAGVKKGVNYAVLVGEKVYTLKRSDHAALDELSKLVWDQAKSRTPGSGDAISVRSVAAAK